MRVHAQSGNKCGAQPPRLHKVPFSRENYELETHKSEDSIIRIPVREILFKPDDHLSFDIIDRNGVLHSIPMRMIREVQKDGKLIWHHERGKH
jgi:hypothetical protein